MTIDVSVTPDIRLVFNVPLLVQAMPNAEATNAGLRRLILERERKAAGLSISNAGGWHSEETLLDWPGRDVATLRGWIDSAIQRISRLPARQNPEAVQLAYRAAAWANVNRSGHYNRLHLHAGIHWAVVYYVAVGEEEPGHPHNGMLELRDPRPSAVFGRLPGFMFGRAITITPKPGLIVVFPAWLEHWVHPFHGAGERISIAVNVEITRYEAPPGGGS